MTESLREKVLGPLGLDNTTDPGTPAIAEPALHAFTSERRQTLNIPAGAPFYEESTYWNPSWTITHGAIETTNIYDLNATAVAIGSGKLLSPLSYKKMLTRDLIGKTTKLAGCTTCLPQSAGSAYGLGIVSSGNWVMQNPLFSGEAGSFAFLPSRKIAIAVAVTFDQAAFDLSTGAYKNSADFLWRKIGAALAPDDATRRTIARDRDWSRLPARWQIFESRRRWTGWTMCKQTLRRTPGISPPRRPRLERGTQTRRINPAITETTNNKIATQNRSFAAATAVPAAPPKPKNAAMIATMRNTTA
jgi:hypothetical protein